MHSIRERYRGALLGCLLGDAFGSVFEGVSPNDPRLEARIELRRLRMQPWRYTDDSAMALGVARSLLEQGRVDSNHLLNTLAADYDPARGYGRGMKLALQAWERGEDPATAAWEEGSRGSGAAVRVVAIACCYHRTLEELDRAARQSAVITHRSAIAIDGCVLHAKAIARALQLSAPVDPAAFIASLGDPGVLAEKFALVVPLLGAPLSEAAARIGNGVTADESVPLALHLFLRCRSDLEQTILASARCGGDVDTIAAMSGTLAGALLGESALPASWLTNSEGVAGARALADRLAELTLDAGS